MTATTGFLTLAILAAMAAVVVGRNLTRSMFAAVVAITAVAGALVVAGAGYPAVFAGTVAGLVLATVQLFGWMLVDVDRDHLPPTDRATWLARSLAFFMLGGGLALLAYALAIVGPAGEPVEQIAAEPAAIGARFFGPWRDLALLVGLVLSATLLATLMLLRDEGEGR